MYCHGCIACFSYIVITLSQSSFHSTIHRSMSALIGSLMSLVSRMKALGLGLFANLYARSEPNFRVLNSGKSVGSFHNQHFHPKHLTYYRSIVVTPEQQSLLLSDICHHHHIRRFRQQATLTSNRQFISSPPSTYPTKDLSAAR